jgi:hypothetical protein
MTFFKSDTYNFDHVQREQTAKPEKQRARKMVMNFWNEKLRIER